MTSEDNRGSDEDLPEAVVETRRRISPIWLIPVAAAIVAGFLFWQSFMQQGATIHIQFKRDFIINKIHCIFQHCLLPYS